MAELSDSTGQTHFTHYLAPFGHNTQRCRRQTEQAIEKGRLCYSISGPIKCSFNINFCFLVTAVYRFAQPRCHGDQNNRRFDERPDPVLLLSNFLYISHRFWVICGFVYNEISYPGLSKWGFYPQNPSKWSSMLCKIPQMHILAREHAWWATMRSDLACSATSCAWRRIAQKVYISPHRPDDLRSDADVKLLQLRQTPNIVNRTNLLLDPTHNGVGEEGQSGWSPILQQAAQVCCSWWPLAVEETKTTIQAKQE